MPDISMCADAACPQSAKCYRFMAVPNPMRQAYTVFRVSPDSECAYFSAIRPGDIVRQTQESASENDDTPAP